MNNVRDFVRVLRDEFDVFNIKNVIQDLESSIENFGVKVYYSDMSTFDDPDSISGYSKVNKQGKPEIIVNGNQSEYRRRFTMAHELGHIIMHWQWLNGPNQTLNERFEEVLFRKNSYSPEENTIRERQANEFAAELLAPMQIVQNEIGKELNLNELQRMFIQIRLSQVLRISDAFAKVQVDKALTLLGRG